MKDYTGYYYGQGKFDFDLRYWPFVTGGRITEVTGNYLVYLLEKLWAIPLLYSCLIRHWYIVILISGFFNLAGADLGSTNLSRGRFLAKKDVKMKELGPLWGGAVPEIFVCRSATAWSPKLGGRS